MIFDAQTPKDLKGLAQHLTLVISAPYTFVEGSVLGGLSRASMIIKVSLDPRSKWKNGIFHNSRYAMFHLGRDGALELFSKRYDLPKMRKSKATGIPDAARRINAYLAKARKETK